MRDYKYIERYLNQLIADIYPQPPDTGHLESAKEIVTKWLPLLSGLNTIVDVGCGQGQVIPLLSKYAPTIGVTLGEDAKIAKGKGFDVKHADMSFLPFVDNQFDLIFARHVLEHSPMPLLTLMEWHRVSKQWALIIVPGLNHFGPSGRNHYYVLKDDQWVNLFTRAGWHPIWMDKSVSPVQETRFMCEKNR